MRISVLGIFCLAALGCTGSSTDDGDDAVNSEERGIVGGSADSVHNYVVGIGDQREAFCSGTVISRRTVITAGHCFGEISAVYFGPKLDQSATRINVVKSIRHPGYDESTITNDLTILELASDAPVQPAPLLRETMVNSSRFVGPNYTFVGYGITGSSGAGFGLRRLVEFPILAVGPGRVGGTPGNIDETQFYYKSPRKNTCNGDSGGPAFIVLDGVERHAGVTSFGDDPCTLDGVQARTDAPQIESFIQPNIDAFEGDDPCRADGACSEACNTGPNLVDPDCADKHCGADGICSMSCASPRDPDCSTGGSGGGTTSCAHNMCTTGGVLQASCDTCAASICAVDSYCCKNRWDATCVKEVNTVCGQTCR